LNSLFIVGFAPLQKMVESKLYYFRANEIWTDLPLLGLGFGF
jgi:hypothetical protein